MLFLEYPKCSTCQKAKKWLDANNVSYVDRDIVLDNPKENELKEWINLSKLEINKFFNTSGLVYKDLNLKERINNMTDDEKIQILATNGKLVKRPILVTETTVLVGFKEDKWKEILK